MKNDPLKVEIEGDRLVISIGVSTLAHAVRNGPYFENLIRNPDTGAFDEDRLRFTDEMAFAKDVVRSLNDEREDGTTRVHLMLDSGAEHAFENGAEGVEFE